SGCTDYLSKPVDRHHLIRTAARHLPGSAVGTPEPADADVPVAEEFPADSLPAGPHELDEGVRKFLPQFLARLPEQVVELCDAIRHRDLERLADAAHVLSGTAGMYGFADVGDLAYRTESLIRPDEPDAGAVLDLERLAADVEE